MDKNQLSYVHGTSNEALRAITIGGAFDEAVARWADRPALVGDLIVSELFTAVAADFLARYGPGGAQLDPGTELFAIFGVGYIT